MPANRIKLEPALERRYAKRKERRKKRPVTCKILIVCEGTKTEPNYFEAFKTINRGTVIYDIDVKGLGQNTMDVVDKAMAHGIDCAWSNEAFELWYLYHFVNRVKGLSRTEYQKAITDAVNKSPNYKLKKQYQYAKNDKCNYQIMNTYGSMEKAIRFAEAKSREYNDRRYASHNPCTMVFKLVRQLIGKDTVFNEEIKHKIDNK